MDSMQHSAGFQRRSAWEAPPPKLQIVVLRGIENLSQPQQTIEDYYRYSRSASAHTIEFGWKLQILTPRKPFN